MIEQLADAPFRLAILDDHELLLDSVSSWVQQHAPDFEVVLAATTWLELVHSDRFPTDVVLLDFQLAEPVSIEARVRTCRAAGATVIVISSLDTPDARERARAAGATAFLAKSLAMHEVMDAVRECMQAESAARRDWRPLPSGANPLTRPGLSAAEAEALTLYASGLTTSQLARRMNVQFETAKTYLRRVREKYARVGRPASRKAELIVRAAEDGYLS